MPLKCPHPYLWIISIFPGISLHYHKAASYWNTRLTRFIWKFPDNNDWGITGPPKARFFLEMHYKSRIFNAFEQTQKLTKLYLRKNCAPALLHHKENKTVPEVQPVRVFFFQSYKLINFIAKKFLFSELCIVTQNWKSKRIDEVWFAQHLLVSADTAFPLLLLRVVQSGSLQEHMVVTAAVLASVHVRVVVVVEVRILPHAEAVQPIVWPLL